MKWKNCLSVLVILTSAVSVQSPHSSPVSAAATSEGPVISEVAWMGTTTDANDEWVELYNPTSEIIQLDGWKLKASDGTPSVQLTGTISPGDTYLLERTDDLTVPGITADQIYTGALSNTGEVLELIDSASQTIDTISSWYAGDSASRATMERKNPSAPGDDPQNWQTATASYDAGFGTPGTVTGTSNGQPEQVK